MADRHGKGMRTCAAIAHASLVPVLLAAVVILTGTAADLSDAYGPETLPYAGDDLSETVDDDPDWVIYLAVAGGVVLTIVIAIGAVIYFRYNRE